MLKNKFTLLLLLAPLVGLMMGALRILYLTLFWTYQGPNVEFNIDHGERFSSINYRLKKNGLIPSDRLFHRLAQYRGDLDKFKSGTYLIEKEMGMMEVLETLVKGKSLSFSVTIPEGKNMYEVADILDQANLCPKQDFLELATNSYLLKQFKIAGPSAEGFLYPDTYLFSKGSSCKQIITHMIREFWKKADALDLNSSTLNIYQVVTLASIVEKETGAKYERPMIAGVFHNRLKKHMRLQSDPTTIYGIWKRYKGNLRKADLLEETPYNTYKIPALPLGPISNPGLDSLKAVISPAQHKYLFFVSQNDGTHIFTEKYGEHLQAVNKHQKDARARKGKSWRQLKQ